MMMKELVVGGQDTLGTGHVCASASRTVAMFEEEDLQQHHGRDSFVSR